MQYEQYSLHATYVLVMYYVLLCLERTSSLEEIFLDPGFFWSWARFEDRWTNYFGFSEDDLLPTNVNVIDHINILVCADLKSSFMKNTQFIKVRG